jgi:hypothetical protein
MATKPKTTTSAGTTMSQMDMVQNPNFNSSLMNKDYLNMLSQLIAERQARGPEAGIMPIGGTGISAEQMQNLSPERRQPLEAALATQNNGNMAGTPMAGQPIRQNPAMGQMANYNQMLQQGMRRNQDMNQAVQNLAAPTGPARSFSQVVGGVNRMNRMPRQPRNNSLAPSNQKLI